MPLALESPTWNQLEQGDSVVGFLRKWQSEPVDELSLTQFADVSGCSDCCYDAFFPALPYVAKFLEKLPVEISKDLIQVIGFRVITAAEAKPGISTEHIEDYQIGISSIQKLLVKCLASEKSTSHDKRMLLSISAAIYGEPDLAREIARIGMDESD